MVDYCAMQAMTSLTITLCTRRSLYAEAYSDANAHLMNALHRYLYTKLFSFHTALDQVLHRQTYHQTV